MQIAKDTNSNEHIQSPEQSKRCEMFGYAFGSGNVVQKSAKKAFHRERYLIERERKQTGDLCSILSLKNDIS